MSCAPIKQTDGDHHDYRHRRRTRTWQWQSQKDVRPRINGRRKRDRGMTAPEFALQCSIRPRSIKELKSPQAIPRSGMIDPSVMNYPSLVKGEGEGKPKRILWSQPRHDPQRRPVFRGGHRRWLQRALLHRPRVEKYRTSGNVTGRWSIGPGTSSWHRSNTRCSSSWFRSETALKRRRCRISTRGSRACVPCRPGFPGCRCRGTPGRRSARRPAFDRCA